MKENNARSSEREVNLENGFYIIKYQNDTDLEELVQRDLDKSNIQLHFSLKGEGVFRFNQGSYQLMVTEENSLLLYNTQKDLPIDLVLKPNTWVLSVILSIQKFHSLFSEDAGHVPFLDDSFGEKKYYAQEGLTPAMAVVISQIMGATMPLTIEKLYVKGKIYELLSLYFNKGNNADLEQCPFLADEENVRKIKLAKEIIIDNMTEPPTLAELSEEVGLGVKKLKEGFKQIYGDSVYSFLLDHKMDYARKLLESGKHNVNEVGLKVGYSTASHFIASFKKKYGTTPKKYLSSTY